MHQLVIRAVVRCALNYWFSLIFSSPPLLKIFFWKQTNINNHNRKAIQPQTLVSLTMFLNSVFWPLLNAILNNFPLYSKFKLGIGTHRQQHYLYFDYWDVSDFDIHWISIRIISGKISTFDPWTSTCILLWCLLCRCNWKPIRFF